MFSFLQVALFIYVQVWRARSRSGASCFPADCADLHRCRSGRANPTDRAQARQMPQMPFGCFLFSHRSRRFAQMPFGVFLVFPQIAQICTDAVRVLLVFPQIAQICTDAVRGVSCFPADCADLQMPFGVFLVFPQIAQICTDARSGCLVFHTDCAVGAKV